jgi:hypothetical protein
LQELFDRYFPALASDLQQLCSAHGSRQQFFASYGDAQGSGQGLEAQLDSVFERGQVFATAIYNAANHTSPITARNLIEQLDELSVAVEGQRKGGIGRP